MQACALLYHLNEYHHLIYYQLCLRLATPTIEFTGNVCLSFLHEMHGRHVGSLAVYVTDDVTPTSAGPVWLQVGSAGSGWRSAMITVYTTGQAQVILTGNLY